MFSDGLFALDRTFQGDEALTSSSCAENSRWNAVDFGVVCGDETVDNTEALQRALNVAGQARGGIVELPSGRFRFDGVLSIPAGVTLQGTYRVPPTVVNKDEIPTGTTLLTYANRGNYDGKPFVTLSGDNSAIAGVSVIYPEWKQTDVPPVPYPPCIASNNTNNVAVLDCCLLNPYEGIKFTFAHRQLVRNVTGYPSWRGFFVDECYDIGHIENVHFWPFGVIYKPDDPYCEWVNVNGTAFEFARSDWHYVSNTFCFGYGCGYYFTDRGHGGTNGNFLGIGADSCRRAVLVEQSQKQGLLITNGEFVGRWTSEDSVCVEIGEKNKGSVMLTNCSFGGPVKTCVWVRAKESRVVLTSCDFVNWDEVHSSKTRYGAPAIKIDAGRASLTGNAFEKSGVHLLVGDDVRHITAIGNQAPGGFRVQGNLSAPKIQLAANEADALAVEPEGKENYQVRLGAEGDVRFVQGWYEPEEGQNGTFRWSSDVSFLTLPIVQDKVSTVILTIEAPKHAVGEKVDGTANGVGVFIGEKKVADLVEGSNIIELEIDPEEYEVIGKDEIVLTVCCNSWRPKDCLENSDDERELGVTCWSVKVKTNDSQKEKVFDVNSETWIDNNDN